MFKFKTNYYVYYFAVEENYETAKNIYENSLTTHSRILTLSNACVCLTTDSVIKHYASAVDMVEKAIVIKEPRKEITITVSGTHGSGKTRIAALINKFLILNDFTSTMEFKEENPSDVYENLAEAVETIKKNVKIKVIEKNICRSGLV